MIRHIYSWSSEYVHRGVSDEYWIVYYVRKYLIDFIFGTVYMELDFFNGIRDTIASHFNVSKKCIIWRNQPINLCLVSDNELKEMIGGKYYIISNQIFEVCSDDEIIADFESIFKEIEIWETKCGKKIRYERLGRQDLSCFVPQEC